MQQDPRHVDQGRIFIGRSEKDGSKSPATTYDEAVEWCVEEIHRRNPRVGVRSFTKYKVYGKRDGETFRCYAVVFLRRWAYRARDRVIIQREVN